MTDPQLYTIIALAVYAIAMALIGQPANRGIQRLASLPLIGAVARACDTMKTIYCHIPLQK